MKIKWRKFLYSLFAGRGEWQEKCTCGDRKICTTVRYIEGPGVFGLVSNTLVKCGKFQRQTKLAHKIFLNHHDGLKIFKPSTGKRE